MREKCTIWGVFGGIFAMYGVAGRTVVFAIIRFRTRENADKIARHREYRF